MGAIFDWMLSAVFWAGGFVFKMVFGVILYATVAEIYNRVKVFQGNSRPHGRALLLLPLVALTGTLFMFLLSLKGLVLSGGLTFWVVPRFLGLVVSVGLGLGVGFLAGRRPALRWDAFSGVGITRHGRHLGLWLGTFTLYGVFRLFPWGWATLWLLYLLLFATAWLAVAYWLTYVHWRRARMQAPGVPPNGPPLDLTLEPAEVVVASALIRMRGRATEARIGRSLGRPDPVISGHPETFESLVRLAQDRPALLETLSGLRDKGLLRSKGDVWELAGPLWRLASFRRSQRTVALTRRRGGTAHTRVLHRFGGVALVVDLEPSAVRLREYPLEGAFSLLAR